MLIANPIYSKNMKISFKILRKNEVELTEDFLIVSNIAAELEEFLNQDQTQKQIDETHKLHAKSGEIQKILIEKAHELGFQSEKNGLFKNYKRTSLRPDYYKPLNSLNGIIMEVERGKTTINNMDMLDVWKCHICENANYLFLIIPKIRQNNKGGSSPTFNTVVKRLESFFIKKNYLNIDAIFIFGY